MSVYNLTTKQWEAEKEKVDIHKLAKELNKKVTLDGDKLIFEEELTQEEKNKIEML